jgi:hypothetical protein
MGKRTRRMLSEIIVRCKPRRENQDSILSGELLPLFRTLGATLNGWNFCWNFFALEPEHRFLLLGDDFTQDPGDTFPVNLREHEEGEIQRELSVR